MEVGVGGWKWLNMEVGLGVEVGVVGVGVVGKVTGGWGSLVGWGWRWGGFMN